MGKWRVLSVGDKVGRIAKRRGMGKEEEDDIQMEETLGGVGGLRMQLAMVVSYAFARECAVENGGKGRGREKTWPPGVGGVMEVSDDMRRRSW